MSSSRIFLPIDNGLVDATSGPITYIGAVYDPDLHDLPGLICEQTFRPEFNMLSNAGLTCVERLDTTAPLTLVALSRHRDLNRIRFARAWLNTEQNGTIIVSGNKTDGVDAFIKELKKHIDVGSPLAKAHGKVIAVNRPPESPLVIAEWAKRAELTLNEDGFHTAPGLFSADAIDPASRLLTDNLPTTLKGNGADLGAGWGYLSHHLLKTNEGIEQLSLIEADKTALDAARHNINDARAVFSWDDAATLKPTQSSDFVVMNPPFHKTRKQEPALGQAFITSAARILRAKGKLYLVANRQLPYERSLGDHFRNVTKLAETGGFKVFLATGPRSGKP